jgi:hypothetical protein
VLLSEGGTADSVVEFTIVVVAAENEMGIGPIVEYMKRFYVRD